MTTFFIVVEQDGEKDFLEIEAPNQSEAIHMATYLTKFFWGRMTVIDFRKE